MKPTSAVLTIGAALLAAAVLFPQWTEQTRERHLVLVGQSPGWRYGPAVSQAAGRAFLFSRSRGPASVDYRRFALEITSVAALTGIAYGLARAVESRRSAQA